MAKTTLRRADVASEAWQRVAAYAEERRAELRGQLESDADEKTTAKIRGRLAELAELLRLAKAPAETPRTGDRLSVDTLIPRSGEDD